MAARAEPSVRIAQALVVAMGVLIGLLAGLDPKYAVLVAFGLIFALITMLNLTAGVCLFAVVSFFEILASGGASLSVPKLLGTLLVISWLAQLATRERERDEPVFSHPAFIYVLILYTGWTLISVVWAEQPGQVYATVSRLIPNAMLFLVVFTAVRKRDQALWVIGAFVVAALLSAAYGLVTPTDPTTVEDRLAGAGGNANETAASLVAAAMLAAGLAVTLRQSSLRLIAALGVPFCVLGVFLTVSRGGLVALAAALVAAIFAGGRWRGPALAVGITVVLSTVLYFGVFASSDARTRVLAFEGGTGRSDIWKVGWRMVKAEPIRGIGAGNFPNSSVHFLLAPGAIRRDDFIVDEPKVAHNTYLEVLAEQGVIGLGLFLAIIGFPLWCALKAAQVFTRAGDRQMEILCRALFVALVGILASDFFGSRQASKQLWLLMSLAPALLAIAHAELATWRQRRLEPASPT
jgi:O-antigen ligase